MRRAVSGQRLFSLVGAAVGVGMVTVGVASLLSPVLSGWCLGFGMALLACELAAVAQVAATPGLLLGGVAVGVVIVFIDGVIDVSLPGVVVGGGLGLGVAGAARYAEHVIVVEGPSGAMQSALARVWLPWRDLFLALGGRSLRQAPVLPTPPASSRR